MTDREQSGASTNVFHAEIEAVYANPKQVMQFNSKASDAIKDLQIAPTVSTTHIKMSLTVPPC